MHLVMSARAGTDVEAFRAAAREFLAAEFGQHRYVFSLHDPGQDPKTESAGGKRPHVHVHAIVAMRSEDGERVETSIASFRRWREGLAQHAREHGIRMEMTDRRDQANAASYTKNQVRPINREGRTEHVGTSDSAARRYDRKRREVVTVMRTSKSQAYTETVHDAWEDLARDSEDVGASEFAKGRIMRVNAALEGLEFVVDKQSVGRKNGSPFQTKIVSIFDVAEVENMSTMTRSEFEAYEKRVETALFQAERVLPQDERSNFEEIAAAAREHVDVRREMMEQVEQVDDRAPSSGSPRQDDANRQWDEAVARHGPEAVEAGNNIMVEVEYYRERIERADDDEIRANKVSLQASLNFEMATAAELGASGNSYLREIAEADEELRVAIAAAERSRDRAKDRADDDRAERANGYGEQDASLHGSGDENRTVPAKQLVPRSEELQHEAEQKRDRDEQER
jgi:hypothetical protein